MDLWDRREGPGLVPENEDQGRPQDKPSFKTLPVPVPYSDLHMSSCWILTTLGGR